MIGVEEVPPEDMNSAIGTESGDGVEDLSFRRMPKVAAKDDNGRELGNIGEVWLPAGDATISSGMSSQSSKSAATSCVAALAYACNVASGGFSCEDGVLT
jgi:hypothetical protein